MPIRPEIRRWREMPESRTLADISGVLFFRLKLSCLPRLNGRGSPFCEVMVFTFTDAGYLPLAASLGFRGDVLRQVVDQLSRLRPLPELLLLLEVD